MKRFLKKKQVLVGVFAFLTLNLFPQTFVEQTGISLPGVSNGSTSWGDYNNDGYLDLLISGGGSSGQAILNVFKNNGNNTFSDLGSVFSPAISGYLYYGDVFKSAWVDFDNDSYLDIIVSLKGLDDAYKLMIYRNNGNNTFTLKYTYSFITFQGGTSFDCGDYDNDGDIDILVTTSTDSKILNNQGNFVFSEQFAIDLPGVYYSSARWIDYDRDGDLDILITGAGYSYLYQNQGNNSFVKQNNPFPGGYGGTPDWGDYNNDGFPDLLFTGGGSFIFTNNGNNTFSQLLGTNLPNTSNAVAKWGDFDNDGTLDFILTGNYNSSDITKIYLNNKNGSFSEATGIVLTGVSEGSIGLGDYDNDGDLDIVISGKNGPTKICKIYKNTSSVVNPLPAAPTGLTVSSSGNDIILKWNRVKTDNTPAKALTYNVLSGTVSNGIDLVNPHSLVSGFRKIASIGNTQYDTAMVLRNINKATFKWKVQAVDNSFKGGPFSTESSFTYSSSCQAYSLYAKKTEAKSVSLQWVRGNGNNCIVFMKMATSGTATPANNTTYIASSIFGSGTQIGSTGWFCVYKGSSNSTSVSGLSPMSNYVVQVQEFTGVPGSEIYNNLISAQNSITLKTGLFTDTKNALLKSTNGSFSGEVQIEEASWLDFDNDGDLDLFIRTYSGYYLFRNDGNNVFTQMPLTLNDMGDVVKCVDFNNDGYIDITTINNSGTYLYVNNGNNTFTELTGTSLAGLSSAYLDWGDFDNDGDLDLIITGEDGSFACTTKIYRNNGNSTFTEVTNHNLPGIRIGNTDWGDYDNDGYLDLIMSGLDINGNNLTSVFRNDGKGSFTKVADLGSSYRGVVKWGDYDNDGDLDILIISHNMIFRNDGNNTFTAQTQISLGSAEYGYGDWGDYDNDGYLDIIITGYQGLYIPFTKLYRNNHDNTFSEETNAALTQVGSGKAVWGDYDKDGDLDLLLMGVSSDSSFTKLYRNDISVANPVPAAPTGVTSVVIKSDVKLTWKSVRTDNTGYKGMTYNIKAGTSSGGINIVSPQSAVNGYRRIVAKGNGDLDTTFFLKNLPLGTYYWRVQAVDNGYSGGPFSAENSFSIVPVQATNLTAKIIDVNSLLLKWERGNGSRCIVFCKEASSGYSVPVNNKSYMMDNELGYGEQIGSTGWYCVYNGRDDSVKVTGLKNKTDYSFHVIEYLGGPGTEQYFTALVNGNPGVFSTGLFSEQTGISFISADFNKFAWGDYNNDGFTDIIIPGAPTKLYKNNGDNTFSEVTQAVFHDSKYGGAYWGDYDNDGDLDVLIMGGLSGNHTPAYTRLYRNDGNGIFTEQTQISFPGVYNSSAAWGDYDNDGDLDLILTGATGDDPFFNPITKIYRNNGDGTFTAMDQIVLPGVYRGDVKWVDYDNDGDLDICLSGSLDYQFWLNCICRIYRNDGNNVFTLQSNIQFPGLYEASTDWADYDNDGDLDVAMTTPGNLYVYQNQGNSFREVLNKFYPYSSYGSVRWGDFDNDGFIDILFTNFAAASIIFKNNIGQGFSELNDPSFAFTAGEGLEWCDYDNDGDIDVMAYSWGENCKLLRNNLIMKSGSFKPNNAPVSPLGLSTKRFPSGITLNWKPVTNDETNSSTLSYNVKIGKTKNNEDIVSSHSLNTGFRKIVGQGNAQLDTSYLIKNLSAGKYYWKVQAVDQGFKGGTWSAIDSVDVKTVLAFFRADEVCESLPTTFTNQSTAYGDVIQTYSWNFGDGTTSTLQNPTHIFSSSGVHNVTLTVSSATNSDILTKPVNVKASPQVDFSATTACQGTETALVNLTNTNGINITSWSWDYGDGKGSTFQDPGTHGYLLAGDYKLTLLAIASNSCSDTVKKTVTVGAIPVAEISANKSLTFCEGDNVTLSVSGNTDYSYKWLLDSTAITSATLNSFVATQTGKYSVEVTNSKGSCKTTSSKVTVTSRAAPSTPKIIPLNYEEGKCPGENQIILEVDQPVSEYTYQWKRNGAPISNATESSYSGLIQAGDYSVVVEQSGCLSESEIKTLTFNDAPEKPYIFMKGPIMWYFACNITDTSKYKYEWYFNGNLIPGANQYLYVAGQNLGNYYVSIGNDKGCYTASDEVTIPPVITGIEDIDLGKGIKIYPNPTSGRFTIEMNNEIYGELVISVLNQTGKELLKVKVKKTTQQFSTPIDLSGQSKGLYLINIKSGRFSRTDKIAIE